jgi:hypothetical protein
MPIFSYRFRNKIELADGCWVGEQRYTHLLTYWAWREALKESRVL